MHGANVGCLERYVVGSSVGAGVPTIRFFDGFGMGYADGPSVRVAGGSAVIGNSVGMSVRGSIKDLLGSTVASKVGKAVLITILRGGGGGDTEGSIYIGGQFLKIVGAQMKII